MPKIGNVFGRLLPNGSNPDAKGSIRRCPEWPPDVYAVAATLLESCSGYALRPFTAGWSEPEYLFTETYLQDVTTAGGKWAETGVPPAAVRTLWRELLKHRDKLELDQESLPIVIRLLAIADEAASGLGFAPDPDPDGRELFPTLLLEELAELVAGRQPSILPHLPGSVCRMISSQELCVQPKTNTPTVGCTLRSLSHNLALLPPRGIVATSWLFAHPDEGMHRPFNVLLIPFPFVISSNEFTPDPTVVDQRNRFFSYRAGCFDRHGEMVAPSKIADAFCTLIEAARREARQIHAVVLPETALSEEQGMQVARELAKRNEHLELFISGIACHPEGPLGPRNCAYTARLYNGGVLHEWTQSKHHRWCLETGQIVRYHLGSVLDPNHNWWEKIDVSNRTCAFTVIRRGASLAVLVCEDLARFDPVLPVINAIGPNLVIALLMDGPQLERRWPGRYATVLADDPGSSVLTLTSLGMIRRSCMPGDQDQRQIALWKEPGDSARELKLPPGDHALLLSLTTRGEQQITLDRRHDHGATQRFRLSGARGVRFPRDSVPDWLNLD